MDVKVYGNEGDLDNDHIDVASVGQSKVGGWCITEQNGDQWCYPATVTLYITGQEGED